MFYMFRAIRTIIIIIVIKFIYITMDGYFKKAACSGQFRLTNPDTKSSRVGSAIAVVSAKFGVDRR